MEHGIGSRRQDHRATPALDLVSRDFIAVGAYIRWRNQHTRPKSGFATSSKIRRPDYPFKAA